MGDRGQYGTHRFWRDIHRFHSEHVKISSKVEPLCVQRAYKVLSERVVCRTSSWTFITFRIWIVTKLTEWLNKTLQSMIVYFLETIHYHLSLIAASHADHYLSTDVLKSSSFLRLQFYNLLTEDVHKLPTISRLFASTLTNASSSCSPLCSTLK